MAQDEWVDVGSVAELSQVIPCALRPSQHLPMRCSQLPALVRSPRAIFTPCVNKAS